MIRSDFSCVYTPPCSKLKHRKKRKGVMSTLKLKTRNSPKHSVRELKTSSGNQIIMQPGSTLEFVESDSGAYRRMIQSWLNSPDLSDHDFRQAVRAISK